MMNSSEQHAKLSSIYYSLANPSGLGSVRSLQKAARSSGASSKDVVDFLRRQNAYTLHRPARVKIPRNRTYASAPNEQWQADLVILDMYAKDNDKYKYVLMVIDVFTKFAYARPLLRKDAATVREAFEEIFQHAQPLTLFTDKGGEFVGLRSYMSKRGINLHFAENPQTKAAVVERLNRTIKSRMHRYFTAKGTFRYVDILQQLMDSYNRSYHRSIKMRPIDVTHHNKKQVFRNLYGKSSMSDVLFRTEPKPKFKVGDTVRIPYDLSYMDKRYQPLWKDETFTIAKALKGSLYRLKDDMQRLVQRRYYERELQLVIEPEHRIARVVRHDKRGKRKYVEWLGYGREHDSWVPEDSVRSLA